MKAQDPHPQRLVVPGQHRASQAVETPRTHLAPIALPARLGIVVAVPDDGAAAAHGAAHTFRPTVLAHQREALGVIQQARKVDQVGCRHDKSSSCEPVSYSRLCSRTRCSQPNCPVLALPPRNPTRAFLVMLESGVASRVAPYLDRFRDKLDPHLVETVEAGLRHGAVALQNAGAARSAMFRALQTLLSRCDVIVSPVLTCPPPPLDTSLPDGPVLVDGEPSGPIRGGMYPYTFPYNLTGHPALALPCGRTINGLPIGLQIVGRWHEDTIVLAVGALVETLLNDCWCARTLPV